MKKRILFVIPSLRCGGAEKSLITLLSLFDYKNYDANLLSFRHDGLFFYSVPKEVNIVGGNEDYEIFDGDAKKAILYFLKKGKFSSVVDRIKYAKLSRENDAYIREKNQWKLLKKQLPQVDDSYDCVVGYLEGNASYYAAEFENVQKKIVFFHNSFKKLGIGERITKECFDYADKIVTVSQECKKELEEVFPSINDKLCVIHNITSPLFVNNEAKKFLPFEKNSNPIIVSVGRLSPQKAVDLEIKTCAELKKRNKNFIWYHVGSGDLYDELRTLTAELGVEKDFVFLGEQSNPYPYIAQADIYVQTSKFEGKSIAIDEAKCLNKPIIVTNFTTVYDQISDGENGLICEMNEIDIADKIDMLLENEALCKSLSERLSKEKNGNEEEIKKFYALLED